MKKKYIRAIVIACLIINFGWGLLGTWLYINFFADDMVMWVLMFIAYCICLVIPVRMIANRARRDMI